MPIMSIEAVGGYLRALVIAQPDLSYASVCREAGVKANYLSRLGVHGKKSTKEPSARVLLKLVRAARGTIEDLEQLSMEMLTDYSTYVNNTASVSQVRSSH